MKKLFALLMILGMFVFCTCGVDDSNDSQEPAPIYVTFPEDQAGQDYPQSPSDPQTNLGRLVYGAEYNMGIEVIIDLDLMKIYYDNKSSDDRYVVVTLVTYGQTEDQGFEISDNFLLGGNNDNKDIDVIPQTGDMIIIEVYEIFDLDNIDWDYIFLNAHLISIHRSVIGQ
jgi:hypothetical protein